jgi:hypothetical protein
VQEEGFPQHEHFVLQVLVPPHQALHQVDPVQLPEKVHLLLELLDELLVAPPDILLRYSVVLPFLVPLLL